MWVAQGRREKLLSKLIIKEKTSSQCLNAPMITERMLCEGVVAWHTADVQQMFVEWLMNEWRPWEGCRGSLALECLKSDLKIRGKVLQPNHPSYWLTFRTQWTHSTTGGTPRIPGFGQWWRAAWHSWGLSGSRAGFRWTLGHPLKLLARSAEDCSLWLLITPQRKEETFATGTLHHWSEIWHRLFNYICSSLES